MNVNLLSEESLDAAKELIGKYFDDFRTQREDIDLIYELNDSMYKGATSRGRWDAQERKWIPLSTDNKANVGSVLLHRQVNTRAGMLGAILASGRPLWQYLDRYVEGIPLAAETGSFEAGIMNAFAKWALDQDGWAKKAPEFCTSIYKDSNIFAQVTLKEEEREVWVAEDFEKGQQLDPETGEMVPVMGKRLGKKKGVAFNYPSFTFPYPRNIYVDKYISDMQAQECVIIHSLTSKARLMAEGKRLDQEAVASLDSSVAWDGAYGSEGKESDAEHTDRDFDPNALTGTMLRWDVFLNCPLLNKEWYDPETAEGDTKDYEIKRVYTVWVGNSPDNMVCVKSTDEFDPDGEIPLVPIRALPSDGDMFYHTTHGEVIRSVYCAVCAIRNATIDNFGIRARPPITVDINTMGLIKDLTWKPDAVWYVDGARPVSTFEPPDITAQSQNLISQLEEETKLALATDAARLGEYAGARTSKYEVQRVTSATDTTVALQNAYVIGQLLPWMAKKMLSYTQKFVDAEVIRRVVNAHLPQPVDGDAIGEYDIEVDLVGQYIEDQERAAEAAEAMQLVSMPANAQIIPPATRLALLKQFLEARKFKLARLDFEGQTADSEANAVSRIEQMLATGVFIPPNEGENVDVHLRVARGYALKWQGLEDAPDPRAANIPLIGQYIQALMQLKEAQDQQVAMQQQGMMQQGMGEPQGEPQGGMEGMM